MGPNSVNGPFIETATDDIAVNEIGWNIFLSSSILVPCSEPCCGVSAVCQTGYVHNERYRTIAQYGGA